VGNTPESPTQLTPSATDAGTTPGRKIQEQSWFIWCVIFSTIWGVLTPIYAVLKHFLKWAPVWDAGAGAPRWFDLILTYFCIPVAVLGIYSFSFALVGLISLPFTKRPQLRWYHVVISVPIGTIYLAYSLSQKDTPGVFFAEPFLFGLGVLFLFAVGVTSRISGQH
jgi:hypothetical protein